MGQKPIKPPNENVLPYVLLDSGDFKKLEQVGSFRLVRPSPGAVWSPSLGSKDWQNIDAQFIRKKDGSGTWKSFNPKMPQEWVVKYGPFSFLMRKTSFGHIGIFAEQSSLFDWVISTIQKMPKPFKVLNLFSYTGGSTLASAQGGAEVCHLDAAKGIIDWARENARLSRMEKKPIRWICDDVQRFIQKEVKRGNRYDGLILDPPSFGRGPKKELWKIEEHLSPMLLNLKKIMSDQFRFLLFSCHTPGYTGQALKNLTDILDLQGGQFEFGEMLIPSKVDKPLCSGFFVRWQKI